MDEKLFEEELNRIQKETEEYKILMDESNDLINDIERLTSELDAAKAVKEELINETRENKIIDNSAYSELAKAIMKMNELNVQINLRKQSATTLKNKIVEKEERISEIKEKMTSLLETTEVIDNGIFVQGMNQKVYIIALELPEFEAVIPEKVRIIHCSVELCSEIMDKFANAPTTYVETMGNTDYDELKEIVFSYNDKRNEYIDQQLKMVGNEEIEQTTQADNNEEEKEEENKQTIIDNQEITQENIENQIPEINLGVTLENNAPSIDISNLQSPVLEEIPSVQEPEINIEAQTPVLEAPTEPIINEPSPIENITVMPDTTTEVTNEEIVNNDINIPTENTIVQESSQNEVNNDNKKVITLDDAIIAKASEKIANSNRLKWKEKMQPNLAKIERNEKIVSKSEEQKNENFIPLESITNENKVVQMPISNEQLQENLSQEPLGSVEDKVVTMPDVNEQSENQNDVTNANQPQQEQSFDQFAQSQVA